MNSSFDSDTIDKSSSEESHGVAAKPIRASELMLDDIAPIRPGENTMRVLASSAGILGALVCVGLGGVSRPFFWIAAVFAFISAAGITPLRYEMRASLVTIGAAIVLITADTTLFVRVGLVHQPIFELAVIVLGASLLYRSYYRASRFARVAVGVGILLGWTGLALSGGFSSLSLDIHWQSWAPVLLRMCFSILLMLALLAFMSEATSGGCRTWALMLLGWYSMDSALSYILRHGTLPTRHFYDAGGLIFANVLAINLAVVAIWQLLAYSAAQRRNQWTFAKHIDASTSKAEIH